MNNTPCGRQQKEIVLVNVLKGYKKACRVFKTKYFDEVIANSSTMAPLIKRFERDTAAVLGSPLDTTVLFNIIYSMCKK